MKYYLIVFVMSFILISCGKDEDECKACSEAISHMAEKIASNNCNPSFMQGAVDRIKEDCSSLSANPVIGYLAENCSFNYNGSVFCTDVADGFRISDTASRTIRVNYFQALPNDSILVTISEFADYSYGFDITVPALGSAEVNYRGSEGENTELKILMINKATTDTIYTGKKLIKYHRPDQWNLKRTINVTYDQSLMGYTIVYDYW